MGYPAPSIWLQHSGFIDLDRGRAYWWVRPSITEYLPADPHSHTDLLALSRIHLCDMVFCKIDYRVLALYGTQCSIEVGSIDPLARVIRSYGAGIYVAIRPTHLSGHAASGGEPQNQSSLRGSRQIIGRVNQGIAPEFLTLACVVVAPCLGRAMCTRQS